jgi:hypothetical protein
MELLLNLVWLLTAIAALLLLLGCSPQDRKQFLLGVGALCCAVLLLFPAISASDDLHAQAVLAEDSIAAKRLANSSGHLAPIHHFALFLICAALAVGIFFHAWFYRRRTSVRYFSAILTRQLFGRAPPAVSLV